MNDEAIKEEVFALGYRSTPVVVAGENVIVGYNITKLEMLLNT